MKKQILFILTALYFLQLLFVPKYQETAPEGSLIGEYYRFSGENDVLFIGDCEVYENFSPPRLWEQYGIPSAIRGSPQQTIWQSYYLLEDCFRYDSPEVVVFNVLAMKYDTPESTGSQTRRESYNRMTLDGMRWSGSKWKAIQESLTQEERTWGGSITYLFPLLRFHSRWQELTREDFACLFSKEQLSYNGYLMQTGVKPVQGSFLEPPPESMEFGQNSYAYLDKIRLLCKEKGAELILVKAPSLSPIWYPEWDGQIRNYADTYSLSYYNFLEAPIGLNWDEDTYDGGLHLNVRGAEKLTDYFGAILQQAHGLSDRRENSALFQIWAERCARYHTEERNPR